MGGGRATLALGLARRSRTGALCLLAFALLAPWAAPPAAQTASPVRIRAILQRTQPRSLGLPFLKPNATPAWYGEYLVGTEPGVAARVWLVRRPVFLDGPWTAGACGAGLVPGARTRERTLEGNLAVVALEYSDRRLFVEAPAAWADRCRFIAALAERVDYFLRYAKDPEAFSLPAILELPAR